MNQQERPQITCGFHDHLRPAAGQSKLVKQKSVKIEECRTDKQIEFLQNISVKQGATMYNPNQPAFQRRVQPAPTPKVASSSVAALPMCSYLQEPPYTSTIYIVGWPIGRVVCIGRRRVGSTSEVAAGL